MREVRNLRTSAGTPAGAWIPLVVDPAGGDARAALSEAAPYVETLAHVRPIEVGSAGERPTLVAATPLGAAWLVMDSAGTSGAQSRQGRRARGEHRAGS